MDVKSCSTCGTIKPLSEYHNSIDTPDGHLAKCKVCKRASNKLWREANKGKVAQAKKDYRIRNWDQVREYQKEYRKKYNVDNREFRRRWLLSRRYGISMDDFSALLESQSGACGICRRTDRKMVVDHDHVTGIVRGILCVRCNVSLGSFGDSIEGLMVAVEYLRTTSDRVF